MIVTTVHIWVKQENIEGFIEASIENHKNSINESGNMRFDILQHQEDPSQFTFYEAYETEDAVVAHKETEHYVKWRDTVKDWMEKPRMGVKHKVIAPMEVSKW